MFAALVEAGKLERALDVVERLHLEKSFDLAMKIADHHRKLVDLIEEAKEGRFGGEEYPNDHEDDHGLGDNDGPETGGPAFDRQRITPDAASSRKTKRAFDDINGADLTFTGNRQVRNRSAFA
jgi:chromosome transmission fidelity protein 4